MTQAADFALGAPPVAVTAISIFGVSLADWAYGLTILYTVLLIAWHLKSKWFAKGDKAGQS